MSRMRLSLLARAGQLALVALLPGLLAGIHFTGLLLFLNPGLQLRGMVLVRGTLLFGTAAGLGFLALLLSVRWFRTRAGRFRSMPWTITFVCTLAAVGAGFNASRFAFYLPSAVNDQLIKAAVWLGLAAILGFYTSLLHSLHRRRYGVRSRSLFVVIAVASIFAVLERRQAVHPSLFNPPRLADVHPDHGLQTLVLILPGASLDLILPLAEQGNLPFLASVLHGGSLGRLSTIPPERVPSSWASLVTGKLPFRHGVVDRALWEAPLLGSGVELRLLPAGTSDLLSALGVCRPRPIDSGALLALPLWGSLSRVGLQVATVDVPFVSGAGSEVRWALDERAFTTGEAGAGDPLAVLARRLEVSPRDIPEDVREGIGSEALLGALAGDLWRRDVGSRLLGERPDLDVLVIRLPGLEAAGLGNFGGFQAAQVEGSRARRAREAAGRLTSYAEQVDRMLGSLWAASTRPDHLLIVASPYGIGAPSRGRRLFGELFRQPALAGELGRGEDGLLLAFGRGIRAGVEARGARVVDLAPSLYYALGLPIPRDLDGRVLTELFEPGFLASHPLTFVPSFETLEAGAPDPGFSGR